MQAPVHQLPSAILSLALNREQGDSKRTLIQNYHYGSDLLFKYNTNFRKTKKYSYQLSFSFDWEREATTVESKLLSYKRSTYNYRHL